MSTLVIVESPGKIEKLQTILGSGYVVAASVGHVRDLPAKGMGINFDTFDQDYELTERGRGVVDKLSRLANKADKVILATDLDREGEAIAWHLQQALNLKSYSRIAFNAITEQAVKNALLEARAINEDLVNAQKGRRVLDRFVGYLVSGSLNQLSQKSLSAGRVQSVALMILAMLEKDIITFKPTNHYGLIANFSTNDLLWSAEWDFNSWAAKAGFELNKAEDTEDGEEKSKAKPLWTNGSKLSEIQNQLEKNPKFTVISSEGTDVSRSAPPPFTTSSLQQAGNNSLGFSVQVTMSKAQKLYEAGLITYHRTDCLNLAEEAVVDIRNWISKFAEDKNLTNLLPATPNVWDSGESAQEAHEAIRPSHIEDVNPNISDPDEKKIYELIWKRTVASQMTPAKFFSTKVVLLSDEQTDGACHPFIAKGSILLEKGWKHLLDSDGEDEAKGDKDKDKELPDIVKGNIFSANKLESKSKKTTPPSRLTEASLVKTLEKKGIGRPSTYAAIIKTLFTREYIRLDGRKFCVTSLGMELNDKLSGQFSFMSVEYTNNIEKQLDLIAHKKGQFFDLMSSEYSILKEELHAFNAKAIAFKNGGKIYECPKCKSPMRSIKGKSSVFWGCSKHPDCNMLLPDMGGRPAKMKAIVACPACSSKGVSNELTIRYSPKLKKLFWSCPKDDCETYYPDMDGLPDLAYVPKAKTSEYACPTCKEGFLLPRKTSDNREFWACSVYDCKTFYPDLNGKPNFDYKPLAQKSDHFCPNCKAKGKQHYLLPRNARETKKPFWVCADEKCKSFFEDSNGAPLLTPTSEWPCPVCKTSSTTNYLIFRKSDSGGFFACGNKSCGTTLSVVNESPDPVFLSKLTKFALSGVTHSCPDCKKGKLRLRAGLKGDFWRCELHPKCKFTTKDLDGAPIV